MDKAYVDTTVLTNALLKCGDIRDRAIRALQSYKITELPVYAIKEFKQGPLQYFKWFHNKLVLTQSLKLTLSALHGLSRSPQRYRTSTALEAAVLAQESFSKHTSQSLLDKYGATASIDAIQYDEYRLAIKLAIFKAWDQRRKVTTHVVHPLSCYKEVEPYIKRELIELDPTTCEKGLDCCMGPSLKKGAEDLKKMKDAIVRSNATNQENIRRRQLLGDISRLPKLQITQDVCRGLGDAIFSFFAPTDSVILTTNIKDHKMLAESLGKTVAEPPSV